MANKTTFVFVGWIILSLLTGCSHVSAYKMDNSISQFNEAAKSIKLGDSKESVLATLQPTQEGVAAKWRKSPESYKQGNDIIDIHYFRSGRQPDGLKTDDEFTPYVFTNDELTAIGWAALGGPKTRGQVIQPAPRTTIKQEVNVR